MKRILSFDRSSVDLMSLLVVGLILLFHAIFMIHETDDLFISLRYADNIANGLGAVYNVGEFVEGYTTPLWVFLLGGLGWLGMPLLFTAKFLSLLSGVVALCLVLPVAQVWGIQGGRFALFLLVLNSTFAVWSSAAMEMSLFSAFLLAALLQLGRKAWLGSGLFFGLATLTRPEGVLWIGISGLWLLWQSRQADSLLDKVRPGLKVGCGAALLVLPHELWRLSYYGELLPNTFYNKVGFSEAVLWRGVEYLMAAGQDHLLILAPFLLLALLQPSNWQAKRALFSILIIAQLAYIVFVGGDWMIAYRFLVPIIPLICLLVADLIYQLREQVQNKTSFTVGMGLIVLILGLHLLNTIYVGNKQQNHTFFTQKWVPDGQKIAFAIKSHCEPDVSLALFAAGSVGYYAISHPVVDMFGLVTPEVTRSPTSIMGQGMAGHERFSAQIVRDLKPELYIFQTELGSEPIIDEKGWRQGGLAHLVQQFTDDPSFWAEHATRTVELEPGVFWNFVMRHETACQLP